MSAYNPDPSASAKPVPGAKTLLERLVETVGQVPSQAEVYAVRQYSVDESVRRARRLLASTSEVCKVSMDRADWVQQGDRTLVRLPLGGRAVIYHASGAVRITTGLNPMEALFSKMESRDALTRMVEAMAERLRISELAGPRDTLTFERLWQIKAAAADRERRVEPVLCRIVGAYRHMVGQLPVLGPASVAIKMAGGGQLDHFSVEVRETMGEGMEWAPIVAPADAARHALGQLISLMGKSSTPVEQMSIEPSMRFGYVALGKRSGQRMLAPHYIATFQIQGEEAQAYQLLVPGTEKTYMPLCLAGRHPAPTPLRRAG